MRPALSLAFAAMMTASLVAPAAADTIQLDYAMPTVITEGLFAPNPESAAPPLARETLTMSVTIDEAGYGKSLANQTFLFEHSYAAGISVDGALLDGYSAADLGGRPWEGPEWISFGDDFNPFWFSDSSMSLSFDAAKRLSDWHVSYSDNSGGPSGVIDPGFVEIVDYGEGEFTSLDGAAAAPPSAWTTIITETPGLATSASGLPVAAFGTPGFAANSTDVFGAMPTQVYVTPVPASALMLISALALLGFRRHDSA